MLKQLDLCSGAGAGFPLAGIRLGGFKLCGLCENNEYCRDILSKRFPGTPIYGDVGNLPRHSGTDLITASPPCTPFSVQGKRRGADDERDCIPAVTKTIACTKPLFFAIENVPGLLNCPRTPENPTPYFSHLLHLISQSGYDAQWLCVSSGHFGAPFCRERLLLVGISRGIKFPQQPTPWSEQVRSQIKTRERFSQRGVPKSGLARALVKRAPELDEPIGVKNRCRVNRSRRQALGNALDPQIAAIALRRIKYLWELQETPEQRSRNGTPVC